MLRAGMMAAGQMDIDWRIERHARFAPARDVFGMTFGVGGGELASGIAGAGDKSGPDGVRLNGKASVSIPVARVFKFVRRHA